jgi:nucleotide-binding universal stress UspA family protein
MGAGERGRPAVLLGVGSSTGDDVAVALARCEAVARGLPLRVLHVVPGTAPGPDPEMPVDLAAAGQRVSAAVAERVRAEAPGLDVEPVTRAGQVVPAVLAEAGGAALLVLGSGQRIDPARARLGSVATHVTEHARCPVVVARSPVDGEEASGPNTGRVVVGVDASGLSEEAVRFAFSEASWRGAGLTAVHAWQPGEGSAGAPAAGTEAAEAMLAGALATGREEYPEVAVTARVCRDHPVRALLEESPGAALLVVGSHGRGSFEGMLLGSVSQALLRHAATSVAVVRPRPQDWAG